MWNTVSFVQIWTLFIVKFLLLSKCFSLAQFKTKSNSFHNVVVVSNVSSSSGFLEDENKSEYFNFNLSRIPFDPHHVMAKTTDTNVSVRLPLSVVRIPSNSSELIRLKRQFGNEEDISSPETDENRSFNGMKRSHNEDGVGDYSGGEDYAEEGSETKPKKKKKKRRKKKKNSTKKISDDSQPKSENEEPSGIPFQQSVVKYLGRDRQNAGLGQFNDFSTLVADGGENFEITFETIEIKETLRSFSFRTGAKGHKVRSLTEPVKRWPHKEKLDKTDPEGCGFPVCAIIDSRPKRFYSLCHMAKYLAEEGKSRKIVEVQKGGCEDAIEGVGHDRPWASGKPGYCEECRKHPGCSQQVCINDNGHAKTFQSVCEAMKYLHDKVKVILIAFGIGNCQSLYSSCLLTEWWDLDEPCGKGEVEAVIISHQYALNLGKQGRHRACSASQIRYPAEILTLEGQDKVTEEGSRYLIDKDKIVCLNKDNPKKPKPPYFWAAKEATCRDWKLRYCCNQMWGEPVPVASLNVSKSDIYSSTDVIVDAPFIRTLFDDCDWKNFMSRSFNPAIGDLESRELNFVYDKLSTCKLDRFASMFIDTRTREDDTPWDETGDIITKNTAIYGFYCDNKNNEVSGKKCHDYKVRFCCKKEKAAQWGEWSAWSDCTKSCGGGSRKRTRVCVKKEGNKDNCFMDGPQGDIRYREMVENCNLKGCPKDLQWQEWQMWSVCSTTCGKGLRRRQRACYPPKNGGKDCPPPESKQYSENEECTERKCIDAQWTTWTAWTKCSVSCGLGTKMKRRHCVDVANGNRPIDNSAGCLGPSVHQDDCDDGYCPVDGGLTEWQNWGECSLACGPDGYRLRQRYCTNPFPMHGGKDCYGQMEEKGPCLQLPPCPIHCIFSDWGAWSKCSVSCGKSNGAGTRIRYRFIALEAMYGGMKCYGSLQELGTCIHCESKPKGYDGPCINFCPVDCIWALWTSWTGTCRSCYNKGQEAAVGMISRSRQRFVDRDSEYGGKPCHTKEGKPFRIADGLDIEQVKCKVDFDTPRCPVKAEAAYWSSWYEWSICTSVCGKKGYEVRKRRCVKGISGHDSSGCIGDAEEKRLCLSPCPSDGWTEWDAWSPCQVTCGLGQSARRRTCRDDNRGDLPEEDKTCKGIQREQRPCDSGSCSKYEPMEIVGKDVTGLVVGWRTAPVKSEPGKPSEKDSADGPGKGETNSKGQKSDTDDRGKDNDKETVGKKDSDIEKSKPGGGKRDAEEIESKGKDDESIKKENGKSESKDREVSKDRDSQKESIKDTKDSSNGEKDKGGKKDDEIKDRPPSVKSESGDPKDPKPGPGPSADYADGSEENENENDYNAMNPNQRDSRETAPRPKSQESREGKPSSRENRRGSNEKNKSKQSDERNNKRQPQKSSNERGPKNGNSREKPKPDSSENRVHERVRPINRVASVNEKEDPKAPKKHSTIEKDSQEASKEQKSKEKEKSRGKIKARHSSVEHGHKGERAQSYSTESKERDGGHKKHLHNHKSQESKPKIDLRSNEARKERRNSQERNKSGDASRETKHRSRESQPKEIFNSSERKSSREAKTILKSPN